MLDAVKLSQLQPRHGPQFFFCHGPQFFFSQFNFLFITQSTRLAKFFSLTELIRHFSQLASLLPKTEETNVLTFWQQKKVWYQKVWDRIVLEEPRFSLGLEVTNWKLNVCNYVLASNLKPHNNNNNKRGEFWRR